MAPPPYQLATRSRTDIRKSFFSNRVVNLWNNLPTDVKDARTVKIFKARLEKINKIRTHFLDVETTTKNLKILNDNDYCEKTKSCGPP